MKKNTTTQNKVVSQLAKRITRLEKEVRTLKANEQVLRKVHNTATKSSDIRLEKLRIAHNTSERQRASMYTNLLLIIKNLNKQVSK